MLYGSHGASVVPSSTQCRALYRAGFPADTALIWIATMSRPGTPIVARRWCPEPGDEPGFIAPAPTLGEVMSELARHVVVSHECKEHMLYLWTSYSPATQRHRVSFRYKGAVHTAHARDPLTAAVRLYIRMAAIWHEEGAT